MQFSDYLAAGGLERLLIIIGALLIGFWGYRIHAQARAAGLALLGLAGTVLLAALFTAARLPQGVETLAGTPAPAAAPAHPTHGLETPGAPPTHATGSEDVADRTLDPASQPPAPSAAEPTTAPVPAMAENGQLAPLASGDELGGRIVSVRGGNVSLEWSSEDKAPPAAVNPPPTP